MFKTFNRPLSPHLSIYTGQITSIFSIFHRFSAIVLFIVIIVFLFLIKFYTYNFSFSHVNLINDIYLQNLLFFNISILALYHFLNGFRHIFWDFGIGLKILKINQTASFNLLIIIFYIIYLTFKILN